VQRGALALSRNHTLIDECRDDATGLALASANDGGGVAAREFTAIE